MNSRGPPVREAGPIGIVMGCDTPQALPSVYRGQKIVIAGDEKQLPPLTLFRTTDGQEEDNVAVSRAIKKIIVVSSIPPSDLDVTQSQFDGPKLLKRYLEYAYAVSNNDVDRVKGILSELSTDTKIRRGSGVLTFESPFEEEVYEELTKRGFVVHSQVGQSGFRVDLAVVNPEDPSSYLLGIECDGAKYHSSMTARERDVFRQKFLERRGWNIARVWSTKWWHN